MYLVVEGAVVPAIFRKDSRVVERWRPDDSRPEILREVLTWVVPGSSTPFDLSLTEFFAEALDTAFGWMTMDCSAPGSLASN